MVRKKNYNVSENRAAPVGVISASLERPKPGADDACICLLYTSDAADEMD